MSDVLDKVRLVQAYELGGVGVTATLARTEIEEAVRLADGPPELLIDVVRRDTPDVAQTLTLEWDVQELEELLREVEGDSVTLTFGEADLALAIDGSDVEAHGLRNKAAVLAVAAVGMTVGASPAAAAHRAPPTGPHHPAVGTGLVTTPTTPSPPPRGPLHPAEGTGLIPTPGLDAGGGGVSLSSPSTTGAILGGALLVITAAGFASRGQRKHTVRPA